MDGDNGGELIIGVAPSGVTGRMTGNRHRLR
jgi:hypothetical protein